MTYIEPCLLILLAVCVCGLACLRNGRGPLFLSIGVLGLFLLSWPPAEWLFSRPLESRYPIRPFRPSSPPQALVVLGGGIAPPQFERPYPLPNRDTFENCSMAGWIYRQIGPLPVLASEGVPRQGNYASPMRALLSGGGIPDGMIWVENRSRNTHENALYGAAILKQHGIHQIVLVTDAQSMPRAAACFRKQGLAVDPAPSEFAELDFTSDTFLPGWRTIRRNERTLHEVLGLAWYSLHGWI